MNKRFIKTLIIVIVGLVGIAAIFSSMVGWLSLETTGNSALDFLLFCYPIQLLCDLSLLLGFFIVLVALLRIRRVPASAIRLFYFSILFFAAPFIISLFLTGSEGVSMIVSELLTVLCPLTAATLTKHWEE